MGDTLKKVQPGQRMNIPAQTFNTFIDAARDYLQRRQDQGGDPLDEARQMGVVLVKNTTGGDRNLFEIVALDGPVFTPGENEEGFKFHFALKGITPDADHLGNFAILLEPVKDNEIGRALLEGITPVKVQVDTEDCQYADVCDECLHLMSADTGAAHILWIESGTGEKWAVVRLGNPVPPVQGSRLGRIVSYDTGSYTVQPVRREEGGYVNDGSALSGVKNLGELWPEEAGYLSGPAAYDRYVELLSTGGEWVFIVHPPRMV